MVDSNLISDFVLKPLMNNTLTSNFEKIHKIVSVPNQPSFMIKKIKKIDIKNYIYNNLIPQNNVSMRKSFDEIISSVNSGNCALFIDTLAVAYDIDVKGFKQRSVDSPNNEVVIKGPQEAFVENLRTNTSLLRRIINTEKLVIENIDIGDITKTKCSVCYMENIANSDLVAEVKYRLNNLDVDSVLSTRFIRRTYYRWKSNWNSRSYLNRKTR